MKNRYLLFFVLLFCSLTLKSQTLEQYYASAQGKSGNDLRVALHNIISNNTVLSYSGARDALKITDEDPNNSNNVILLYTGWSYPKTNFGGDATEWNREHTWAKSMGDFDTDPGPGTDIHHLRPTDVTVNSARGNLYFDDGGTLYTDPSRYDDGSGVTECYYDGDSWEPRDAVKGDVARMLFYMAIRYEAGDMVDLELAEYSSSSGLHGKLSTLLKWHIADPVDHWELERNERIYNIQGNRNPFINHPEYVELIWNDSGNNGGGDDLISLFEEDFESQTLGKMSEHSLIGDEKTWYIDTYNSNYYAKMSGFMNPGFTQNEDWLINTNPVDLNGYSDLTLSFVTMMRVYDGETSFNIYISSDYDGSSNPNDFTWDEITAQASLSSGNYNIVPSGNIDLSAWASQSIYVGFKYENSALGSNTWQVDDIKIQGKEITSSAQSDVFSKFIIHPNPAQNQVTITSDLNSHIKTVRIMDTSGLVHKVIHAYQHNSTIDITSLNKGLYLVQVTDTDGHSALRKLMVK